MIKKHEKKRGKLQFSFFLKIFAPLEAKMMKHDKKMKKTRGKLQFSVFWEKFCTTGSKNDET